MTPDDPLVKSLVDYHEKASDDERHDLEVQFDAFRERPAMPLLDTKNPSRNELLEFVEVFKKNLIAIDSQLDLIHRPSFEDGRLCGDEFVKRPGNEIAAGLIKEFYKIWKSRHPHNKNPLQLGKAMVYGDPASEGDVSFHTIGMLILADLEADEDDCYQAMIRAGIQEYNTTNSFFVGGFVQGIIDHLGLADAA